MTLDLYKDNETVAKCVVRVKEALEKVYIDILFADGIVICSIKGFWWKSLVR